MKRGNRLLAVLLSMVITLTYMPAMAFATEGEEGTDPGSNIPAAAEQEVNNEETPQNDGNDNAGGGDASVNNEPVVENNGGGDTNATEGQDNLDEGNVSQPEPEEEPVLPGADNADNNDSEPVEESVASIGDAKYSSLADALAASEAGNTIKLLGNIDLSKESITRGGYATIGENCDIVLDLNGHAVTGAALDLYGKMVVDDSSSNKTGSITGVNHAIWVNPNATLEVKAGSVISGTGVAIASDKGNVTITGGEVRNDTGVQAISASDGKINITGGTIISTKDDTPAVGAYGKCEATVTGGTINGHDWGITVIDTSSLTVSGDAVICTSETEGIGISTNGNSGQNATITINGGTISGTNLGIYQPSGTVTVNGGSISGATGIYQKSGKLTITDGTITGNGVKSEYDYNGNGANATGDAIVIDNCGYPGGVPEPEITGGTFNSTNAASIGSYAYSKDGTETKEPVAGFVAGGSFNKAVDGSLCADGFVCTKNADGTYGVATLKPIQWFNAWTVPSAYYFADEDPIPSRSTQAPIPRIKREGDSSYHAVEEFVEVSWKVTDSDASSVDAPASTIASVDENGLVTFSKPGTVKVWLIMSDSSTVPAKVANKTASYKLAPAYIERNGEKVAFSTLLSAFNAAKDGETIVLGSKYTASGIGKMTLSDGRNITVDLNGNEVELNADHASFGAAFTVKKGTLTIKDSTGGGKVKAVGNNSRAFHLDGTANSSSSDAKLVIEEGVSVSSAKDCCVTIVGKATLETEGNLSSPASFAIAGNGSEGKGGYAINVKGGSVTGDEVAIYHPNDGTLTVSGGSVTGDTGIYQKAGTLNITGGTITGKGEKKDYTYNGNGANATGDAVVVDNCGYPGGAPAPSITGGTINSTNAAPVGSYAYTPEGKEANEPVGGFVTGGVFNKAIDESLCEADLKPAKNEDGIYSIVEREYVVQAGEKKYESLAEAIAAAKVGDTVKLLKNIALSETQVIAKDVTIDLNGHDIAATGARALWIKNGNVEITGSGTISATGLNATSSVIRIGDKDANTNKAKLTVGKDVEVSTDTSYGITTFGVNDSDGDLTTSDIELVLNGKVNVTGGSAAISGNGNSFNSATTVTIGKDAEVTASNDYAIYHPDKGTLTVNGKVTGKGGIEMKGGSLEVGKDATVTATATEQSHSTNNDGTSTSGYVIAAVSNPNYVGEPKVEISGIVSGKVISLAEAGAEDNSTVTASSDQIAIPEGYAWEAEGNHFVLKTPLDIKKAEVLEVLGEVNPEEYIEEHQYKVHSLVEKAKKDVENAKTVEEVDTIKKTLDKKLEDYTKLADAKLAAKNELDTYKIDVVFVDPDGRTNAVNAGKDAIDAATTHDAVKKALADAKSVIDALKTKEADDAEKLATAKENAKEALAKYNADVVYRDTEKLAVRAAKADGREAIDAAKTVDKVNEALNAAKAEIDGIKTDDQYKEEEAATTLAEAKAVALEKVNAVKAEDYIEADQSKVTTAKETALAAINDKAATIDSINEAVAAFEEAIAKCKKQADADADDAKALADAKVAAKVELDAYKSDVEYRATEKTAVRAAKAEGREAIDSAKTVEAVTAALDAAKTEIDGIKTAADYADEEAAAEVGGKNYATFADAVAAAEAGDTVKLLKDVALSATQEIAKDVTIDLNGHNIATTDARALWIKSGNVEITGSGNISATGAGLADSSSVIRVGDSAANESAAKLTVGKDVVVSTDKSYGITVFGKNAAPLELVLNGKVNVTGTSSAISGNGSAGLTPTSILIAEGAEVTSANEYGIYHPEDGTLTVNGKVEGKGGIEIKSGKLNVGDKATITATGKPEYTGPNGNGPSTSGYAIASVGNGGYTNIPSVEVGGGSISGTVTSIAESGAKDNGTVTANSDQIAVPSGYKWVATETGYELVVADSVAEVGGNKYESLAAAIEAAEAGDTVTLLKDIALSATQVITKDVTIDMNGHDIAATGVRVLWVKNGNVEITGEGTVSASGEKLSSSSSVIRVGDSAANEKAAKLTVGKDVTVSTDKSYGITVFGVNDSDKDLTTSDIELVLNGKVNVSGETAAISGNGNSFNSATTITIGKDAEVTAANEYAIYHPGKGTLTVNGKVTGTGGIEIKGGSLEIGDSASVTATAEEQSHTTNNNGTSTSGYVIAAVSNPAYAGEPKVDIGGSVTGQVISLAEAGAEDNSMVTANTDSVDLPDGYNWVKDGNGYVLQNPLDAYKAEAIKTLEGIDAEKYVEEHQYKVGMLIESAKKQVQAAKSNDGVDAAMEVFRTELAKYTTLEDAKTAAKNELDAYKIEVVFVKSEDRTKAVADGKTAIDAATTHDAVDKALADAKAAIDALKTKEADDAEKLATAKANAKATLADYKADVVYRDTEKLAVRAAKADGREAIDAAKTVEKVTEALDAAKTEIDGIKTDDEYKQEEAAASLEEAKKAALDKVDAVKAADYVEADQSKVTTAKTTALEAINAEGATIESINEAVAAFEEAIAGCKKQADADADDAKALAEAKADAKAMLNDYDAADYRDAEKTALKAAKADAREAIDAAKTLKEVEAAKAAAKTELDKIKTDAQLTEEEEAAEAAAAEAAAKALADAKTSAKDELAGYKNADDYKDAQKAELTAAVEDGKAAIDEAKSVDAVDKAFADAKAEIDKIKTSAEIDADEAAAEEAAAAKALADAKETAKSELASYKNPEDYRDAEKIALRAIKADGKDAINSAATPDEVATALAAAKAELDKVKTDAKYQEEEAAAAAEAAAKALADARTSANETLNGIDPSAYRDEKRDGQDATDKALVEAAVADARKAVEDAETVEDVTRALEAATNAIKAVPTDSDLTKAEEKALKDAQNKAVKDISDKLADAQDKISDADKSAAELAAMSAKLEALTATDSEAATAAAERFDQAIDDMIAGKDSSDKRAADEKLDTAEKSAAAAETAKDKAEASKKAAEEAAATPGQAAVDAAKKALEDANDAKGAADEALAAAQAAKAAVDASYGPESDKAKEAQSLVDKATTAAANAQSAVTDAEKAKAAADKAAADKAAADKAAADKAAADEAAIQGKYNPKLPKVKIAKPAKKKAAVTVKWKKLSKKAKKQCQGVEVWVARNKKFTKGRVIKRTKKTKKALTVKKLARKKTYYVKVRSYKVVNGVKYVGKWSKIRKIKTK